MTGLDQCDRRPQLHDQCEYDRAHAAFGDAPEEPRGERFQQEHRRFRGERYAPSNDVDVALTNSGVSFNAPPRVSFNRATEELLHDWNMVKGSHSLSWGVQLNWRQYNEDTIYQSSGAYRFDGHVTGFDRADFMLGQLSNFLQNNGELENRRQFNKGFYGGDIWRVSSRLTASFGLRYEPYSFFKDTRDRNQTFRHQKLRSGRAVQNLSECPCGLAVPRRC